VENNNFVSVSSKSIVYVKCLYVLVHFYGSKFAHQLEGVLVTVVDKVEYKKQFMSFNDLADSLLYEIEEDIESVLQQNKKKNAATKRKAVTVSEIKKPTKRFGGVDDDALYEWQLKQLHNGTSDKPIPSKKSIEVRIEQQTGESTPSLDGSELVGVLNAPEKSWRRNKAALFANALQLISQDRILCGSKAVLLEEAIYNTFIGALPGVLDPVLEAAMEDENRFKYNKQVRLFLSNLRASANKALRIRVLHDVKDWPSFAESSAEDLMNPETALKREIQKESLFKQYSTGDDLVGQSGVVDYVECEVSLSLHILVF